MVDNQQDKLKQPEGGESGQETEDAKTKHAGGSTAVAEKPSSASSITADHSASVITDTVYVGNIPLHYATEVVIEKLLQPYGRLRRITVQHRQKPSMAANAQQPNRLQTIAFAFGQFESPIYAAAAIKALDGRKLGGQRLVVRPAHSNRGEDCGRSTASLSRPASSSSSPNRGVSQQKRQLDSRIEAIRQKLKKGNNEG